MSKVFVVFAFMEGLVGVQAVLAYQDSFLTVSQMQEAGFAQGLPFLWHFGMYGDLVLISPVIAYLVGRSSIQYRQRSFWGFVLLGIVVSIAIGWTYTFASLPEAHMRNHSLTRTGLVHLLYMAIAVTVLIRFFFSNVQSKAELRAVGTLIVVHLLLGTHMVLGLVALVVPLNWYPAHPLQSVTGWTIIILTGAGLIVRSAIPFRSESAPQSGLTSHNIDAHVVASHEKPILLVSKNLYRWWTENEPPETIEGFLKLLDFICNVFGGLAVFSIAERMVTAYTASGTHTILDSIVQLLLPCLLLLVIGLVYALSRHSVRVEMNIGRRLFPSGLTPKQWRGPQTRIGIALSVAAYLTLYLSIVNFVDWPIVVSSMMLSIACIDYNTRNLIKKGLSEVLEDSRHSPTPGDTDYRGIQYRRAVIRWYLFRLPHRRKEALRVFGCALALALAIAGHHSHKSWLTILCYLVLILTLLLNEHVTFAWRQRRGFFLRAAAIRTDAGHAVHRA